MGEATVAPFLCNVSGLGVGTHAFVAVATDNVQGVSTSAVKQITVVAGNLAPSVALDFPSAGISPFAPASFSLVARVADQDGSISQVAFYQGLTLLGTCQTAPYTLPVTNLQAGHYSFTAVATDNQGLSVGSNPLYIRVMPMQIISTGRGGNQSLILKWVGGKPPYRLEFKSGLDLEAPWQEAMLPVSGTNVVVPSGSASGFYRIRSYR